MPSPNIKEIEKEKALIRDELGYIGRYMQGISPKVSRWAELNTKKSKLRARLTELNNLKKEI